MILTFQHTLFDPLIIPYKIYFALLRLIMPYYPIPGALSIITPFKKKFGSSEMRPVIVAVAVRLRSAAPRVVVVVAAGMAPLMMVPYVDCRRWLCVTERPAVLTSTSTLWQHLSTRRRA